MSETSELVQSPALKRGRPEDIVTHAGLSKRPQVHGRFLTVGDRRFWVKGVTYGTFRANDAGEPFPARAQVREDFARMSETGVNTVRLYSPPPDWLADAAAEAGLFLFPDICWGPRRCEIDDPDRLRLLFDWTREHSRRLANHPAILLFSIGNEIPPLIVRWYGLRRVEKFLRDLNDTVKEQAPHALTWVLVAVGNVQPDWEPFLSVSFTALSA